MVIEAAMESKTEGTMWKSIKNYIRNWCQKWPCILFGAIYQENKQWSDKDRSNEEDITSAINIVVEL